MISKLHPLLRIMIALVMGVIISFCVISLAESVNAHYFPSQHINPSFEQMQKEISTSPWYAFLMVFFGYVLSSFFGAYVAARLSPAPRKLIVAMTIGFFLLLGGIVLFISMPHPIWLSIASCVAFMIFAYLGGKLAGG
jgi:hypothetical protein